MDHTEHFPSTESNKDYLWIHDLSSEGRGVARRDDGRIVMVWGAIPGDTIRYEVEKEPAKGPVSGKLIEVVNPSPQRVAHPCPHYERGCPASLLGAIRREFSLSWKHEHLVETFRRIGGLEGLNVEDVIPSPRQWRYRDRLEFQLFRTNGYIQMGYSHQDNFIPIQDCRIGSEHIREPFIKLRQSLSMLDQYPHIGDRVPLRLMLRHNGNSKVVAVLFAVTRGKVDVKPLREWLNQADLAGWEIRKVKDAKARFADSVIEDTEGDSFIYHLVAGRQLKADPIVFSQSNTKAALLMVDEVLEQLPPKGKLLDLYGGFGFFGFEYAERGGKATVYDSSELAIQAGLRFAKESKLPVDLEVMNLNSSAVKKIPMNKYDAIILDPPHSGADDNMLSMLNENGTERIVYVSCHGAALARDLKKLTNYNPELVIPIDMFPSTSELEAIAVLDKK